MDDLAFLYNEDCSGGADPRTSAEGCNDYIRTCVRGVEPEGEGSGRKLLADSKWRSTRVKVIVMPVTPLSDEGDGSPFDLSGLRIMTSRGSVRRGYFM